MTNKFYRYTSLLLTALAFAACGPQAPVPRHGGVDAPPDDAPGHQLGDSGDAGDSDSGHCTLGARKMADDGCNKCTCTKDGWACTAIGCEGTPPPSPESPMGSPARPPEGSDANVAGCPMPRSGPNLAAQVMTYVVSPLSGRCCEYSSPQAAPADWPRFHNAGQCAAAVDNKCSRGESVSAGDGCNSCTCDADGRWSCTELGCIDPS